MSAIAEVGCEVPTAPLCESLGVSRAALYRWRRPQLAIEPRPPRARHPRSLGPDERQAILDALHSERFCDASPAEVHATLLEEETYLASTRTMYRVLAEAHEVRERRDQLRHPSYAKPELLATQPNQVWSWDITKLKARSSGATSTCSSSSTSSAATWSAGLSPTAKAPAWPNG